MLFVRTRLTLLVTDLEGRWVHEEKDRVSLALNLGLPGLHCVSLRPLRFPLGSCPITAQTAKESAYSNPSRRTHETSFGKTANSAGWAHPGDACEPGLKWDQPFGRHRLTTYNSWVTETMPFHSRAGGRRNPQKTISALENFFLLAVFLKYRDFIALSGQEFTKILHFL